MNKKYSKKQVKDAFDKIGLDYTHNSNCFDMARRGCIKEAVGSLMAGCDIDLIRKTQRSFIEALK